MAISAEDTIKGIIAAAKAGNVKDHEASDGKESWKIDWAGNTYKVVVTDKTARSGKAFNKNELFLCSPAGDRVVNLGDWKKKLFYTLVYSLRAGKVFRKIDQDPDKVKAIREDMKANPGNYTRTDDRITGTYKGKPIVVSKVKKTYDSGKTLSRITLAECGVVTLRGSQLQNLFRA